MPIKLVEATGATLLFTSAVFPVDFKEPKRSPLSSSTFASDCSLPYRNAPDGSSYRMIFMFSLAESIQLRSVVDAINFLSSTDFSSRAGSGILVLKDNISAKQSPATIEARSSASAAAAGWPLCNREIPRLRWRIIEWNHCSARLNCSAAANLSPFSNPSTFAPKAPSQETPHNHHT